MGNAAGKTAKEPTQAPSADFAPPQLPRAPAAASSSAASAAPRLRDPSSALDAAMASAQGVVSSFNSRVAELERRSDYFGKLADGHLAKAMAFKKADNTTAALRELARKKHQLERRARTEQMVQELDASRMRMELMVDNLMSFKQKVADLAALKAMGGAMNVEEVERTLDELDEVKSDFDEVARMMAPKQQDLPDASLLAELAAMEIDPAGAPAQPSRIAPIVLDPTLRTTAGAAAPVAAPAAALDFPSAPTFLPSAQPVGASAESAAQLDALASS